MIRSVLLCCTLVIALCAQAQTSKQVLKKMDKARKTLDHYEIEYEYEHKSHGSNDTSHVQYNSEIHPVNDQLLIAWHTIHDLKGKDNDSRIVMNQDELISFYVFKDSIYYKSLRSEKGEKSFMESQARYLYQPITQNYNYLGYKKFKIVSQDDKQIVLEFMDSSKQDGFAGMVVTKKKVVIDAQSYLPLIDERWHWFEGGMQYSKYKLNYIKPLPAGDMDQLFRRSDSMQRGLKKFRSGDSLWQLKQKQYTMLKEGDTVTFFKALLHGSTDSFSLADYKDSIIILDFFYTTCGPCLMAVSHLSAINTRFRSKGVCLFGVDPYAYDTAKLDKFVELWHANYRLLKVDHAVTYLYGVKSYPTLFIIKNGIVIKKHIGFTKDLEKMLEEEIEKLIKS